MNEFGFLDSELFIPIDIWTAASLGKAFKNKYKNLIFESTAFDLRARNICELDNEIKE